MKKLNNKGETIVETLVAILIVSVCFVMIQNSVVTAAKINKQASDINTQFTNNSETIKNCDIQIVRNNKSTSVSGYTCKLSEGEYYYYEKAN